MTLYELEQFAPKNFLGFVRNVPLPNEFKGVTYLPNETTFDLGFQYILGANYRPVMAHVMGFDSEAPIGGRRGSGQSIEGELPPIKRKARIGEKEIARFLTPRANTADQAVALESVYRLAGDLIDSVQARVEWLRMQALSEQYVLYDEAGVIFTFGFGLSNELRVTLQAAGAVDGNGTSVGADFTRVWSDTANSNPISTGQAMVARMRSKGAVPEKWVMSQKSFNYITNNALMKTMLRGNTGPTIILSEAEISYALASYGIPPIEIYDVTVEKENADGSTTEVRTMAENKSFMLPRGWTASNKTLWGPTAESRVLFGTKLASQAPGMWAETYSTTEPPAEWTKAAATAFPTMPQAQQLAQITLW